MMLKADIGVMQGKKVTRQETPKIVSEPPEASKRQGRALLEG